MRKLIQSFLLLLTFASLTMAQNTPLFFAQNPTLSPDGNTLFFSYDGDLWKSNISGGLANRITAMDGIESNPKISPDGKWLAFNSNEYGNNDVFLMPVNGGDIQQLTYHQANDKMASWSWDSQNIYFTSNRYNRMSTYKINIGGGTPARLFGNYFNNIHNAQEHPKNGEIYFNESWESSNFAHRKRYKGPYNPDIKSYNIKKKTFRLHTTYEGKDFGVTIDRRGHVYFISDRANGEYNLYELTKDGEKIQLTKFNTSIINPFVNADGGKIVFQKDYQIFVYDVASKMTHRIELQLAKNNTLAKSKNFKVAGNISAFDIADDGKKIAFVSRGELFVSDIKGKFVKQISTDALGRVSEVYWLKDDKTLLFNQTVGGYQNWFTISADGMTAAKQLTNDTQNNRQLQFNSDKTKAVYLSGRNEVRLMDLETYESELLLKEELWALYSDLPSFSPDDAYIMFTAYRNFEKDIFLYHLKTKKLTNITNTGVTETAPTWSPDGKYIYLTTNRTEPSYPYGLQNSHVYRIALQKFDEPFRADKFKELFKEEEKDETDKADKKDKAEDDKYKKEEEDKKDKEKIKVAIDFKDLMKRMERVSPDFGSQYASYVIQKEGKTIVLFSSDHDKGKYNLWKTVYE
ncbi:MAG TPA: peptidase S41, partial [Saprospiraceae bacterium]|nr:peptidase S41 [Saprospiraceae bacterium]